MGVKENIERVQDRVIYRAGTLMCDTCTNTHKCYATFMHIGLEQANEHIKAHAHKTSNNLSPSSGFSWLARVHE